MTPIGRLARRAGLVLGTGYVLCFFSETVFWALWRPDEDPAGRLLQWLLYSLMGYLTLAVIRSCRVGSGWPLVLAGAFYGWIGEGVFAMTVFGDPSMPFPATIAWTALAWHGPISLLLGWYGLGLALRERAMGPTIGLAFGFGIFWGVWAFGWLAETPPVAAEPEAFLLHAGVTTACLALAHLAIAAGRPETFAPSRPGVLLAAGVVLGFFALFTVPAVPIAPLVLLPLLGLVGFALRRHRAGRAEGSLLAALAAPIAKRNLAAVALMPLTASATYALACGGLPPLPAVHLLLALASSLLGTVLFALAVVKALRRPAGAAMS